MLFLLKLHSLVVKIGGPEAPLAGHPRPQAVTLNDKGRDLGAPAWRISKVDIRRDDPRATLRCEKRPSPFKKNERAIPEADEISDMDEAPSEPSDDARELQLACLRDGTAAPDRRHRTFIDISKGLTRLPSELSFDELREVAALLHRDGRNSWERPLGSFRS